MTNEELAALDRAAMEPTLEGSRADDDLAAKLFYLYRTGKLVLIDDGAVERVASAIDNELVWEIEADVLAASLTREEQIKVARAALSALGVK